ncbi:hypothetical protein P7K49_015184, partial [Saguinus oedipus]
MSATREKLRANLCIFCYSAPNRTSSLAAIAPTVPSVQERREPSPKLVPSPENCLPPAPVEGTLMGGGMRAGPEGPSLGMVAFPPPSCSPIHRSLTLDAASGCQEGVATGGLDTSMPTKGPASLLIPALGPSLLSPRAPGHKWDWILGFHCRSPPHLRLMAQPCELGVEVGVRTLQP